MKEPRWPPWPGAPQETAARADSELPSIAALRLFESTFAIHRAPLHRDWMGDTPERFAYRCLPLVIANQAGWVITSGRTVVATWTGGAGQGDLSIESPEAEDPGASSQFGLGILTWEIPFLFRTSPGYNLLVRGPANWWKEGATPLEGLVETDWAVATFTMNWRITSVGTPVRFEAEDPICMVVPQRRGELESFNPTIGRLQHHSEIHRQFQIWEKARNGAIAAIEDPLRPPNLRAEWELHYLRGTSPGGADASEHQTRLHLREFAEDDSPTSAE